jgi:alpha-1,2-mannosyltransferase
VAFPGPFLPTGQAKWTDFVHFYTLGNIARIGPIELLYDEVGQHARQVALLPEYANAFFRPDTYPPLVAVAFAPLSRLPYTLAGLVWAAVMLVTYLSCALLIARQAGPASPLRDRRFLVAACLAFPPVWLLFIHGQTTMFPFLTFALAWAALEQRRPFIAGLAMGLLALKPQLGVAIALVALLSREWRMIAGAAASVAMQAAATVWLFGTSIVWTYITTSLDVLRTAHVGEVKPYLQHSLRVLTTLLPDPIGAPLLAIGSVAVIWAVWSVWQSTTDPRVRMGVVVLGSVLVNPHLYVYDATLLVLTGLWIGLVLGDEPWFWRRAYWLTVALLVPTAQFARVQLSVVLMLELLYQLWRRRVAIAALAEKDVTPAVAEQR